MPTSKALSFLHALTGRRSARRTVQPTTCGVTSCEVTQLPALRALGAELALAARREIDPRRFAAPQSDLTSGEDLAFAAGMGEPTPLVRQEDHDVRR
jgi:hypothetical protein